MAKITELSNADEYANVTGLPTDVVLRLLYLLDISDLAAVSESCLFMARLLMNEGVAKHLIQEKYGLDEFSSTSGSRYWGKELRSRAKIMRKWAVGVRRMDLLQMQNQVVGLELYGTTLQIKAYEPPAHPEDTQEFLVGQDLNDLSGDEVYFQQFVTHETLKNGFDDMNCVAVSKKSGALSLKLHDGDELDGAGFDPDVATSAVLCVHVKTPCYYFGERGGIMQVREVETNTLLKKRRVGAPIHHIKGYGTSVVGVSDSEIFISLGDKKEDDGDIKKIKHKFTKIEYFEVDFGGKLVVIGDETQLTCYSFASGKGKFGKGTTYTLKKNEKITGFAFEKRKEKDVDGDVAGGDGLNVAIIVSEKRIVTFNIRASGMAVQSKCDSIKWEGHHGPRACCIDINDSVMIIGAEDGWAGIYDVLSCDYIRLLHGSFKNGRKQGHRPRPSEIVRIGDTGDWFALCAGKKRIFTLQYAPNGRMDYRQVDQRIGSRPVREKFDDFEEMCWTPASDDEGPGYVGSRPRTEDILPPGHENMDISELVMGLLSMQQQSMDRAFGPR